jgi:hypothetical protein
MFNYLVKFVISLYVLDIALDKLLLKRNVGKISSVYRASVLVRANSSCTEQRYEVKRSQ